MKCYVEGGEALKRVDTHMWKAKDHCLACKNMFFYQLFLLIPKNHSI